MKEDIKVKIIESFLLREESINSYHDISVKIDKVDYYLKSIYISYYVTQTSRLDSRWSLDKHKSKKIVGTFESIFIKEIRNEKLNQLGV